MSKSVYSAYFIKIIFLCLGLEVAPISVAENVLPTEPSPIPKAFQTEARRTQERAAEHTPSYVSNESSVQQSLRLKDDGYSFTFDGSIESSQTNKTTPMPNPTVWQLHLATDKKNLISWHIDLTCNISVENASQTDVKITYWLAEDKVETTYHLENGKPLELTLTPENSDRDSLIYIEHLASNPAAKLIYHCANPTIKLMTDPPVEATDKFVLVTRLSPANLM